MKAASYLVGGMCVGSSFLVLYGCHFHDLELKVKEGALTTAKAVDTNQIVAPIVDPTTNLWSPTRDSGQEPKSALADPR